MKTNSATFIDNKIKEFQERFTFGGITGVVAFKTDNAYEVAKFVEQSLQDAIKYGEENLRNEVLQMKEILCKKQDEMHLHDERDRNELARNPDSIKALKKVKLNEGTTAHYQAGRIMGSIEILNDVLAKLTKPSEEKKI